MSIKYSDGSSEVIADWKVHLPDGIHHVEFDHGTMTGRRVIRVDGTEVLRKNWMFTLVGEEDFRVGDKPGTIVIESEGLSFTYSLRVDGQTLEHFIEAQNKQTRTWLPIIDGEKHRIVLDTKKMDIYVDGDMVEDTIGDFTDEGAENHFKISGHSAIIKSCSINTNTRSGRIKTELAHTLILGGQEIESVTEAS
jgi:hypothetical protein